MPEFLEMAVDKFTFRVATDRYYTREGMWAQPEGNRFRVGLSDFLQQRSGDVAFAEVRPAGTQLAAGDQIAVIETIKVDLSLSTPVGGTVAEINPALEMTPEMINSDPYGAGWLAVIEASDSAGNGADLLDAKAYFSLMKRQVEEESKFP